MAMSILLSKIFIFIYLFIFATQTHVSWKYDFMILSQ